ncbi:MAG: Fe-Mn family superoxide dismutase [Candidatus Eiseniibacteriota bacterium]|jgi:Fe-Mn family superoxide dismutase
MPHQLPDLPFPKNALAPHISEETLEYHYGKHHAAYVNNLNKLIDGTELASLSLEDTIRKAQQPGVFNNAAQIWNHTFYWHCLSPDGGGSPGGELGAAIDKAFGSFDAFHQKFTTSAATNFGSGWTWLVKNASGAVEIVNTSNAQTPLTDRSVTPLLTIDIWEHAYYVDYRNARPKYIEAFWNIVNWDFVTKNLAKK